MSKVIRVHDEYDGQESGESRMVTLGDSEYWSRAEQNNASDYELAKSYHAHSKPPIAPPIEPGASFSNDRRAQIQSRFFGLLPLEIRLQIYTHCLTRQKLTLQFEDEWMCRRQTFRSRLRLRSGVLAWMRNSDNYYYRKLARYPSSEGLLSVPLTCQRAYEESLDIIYGGNRFNISPLSFEPQTMEPRPWQCTEVLSVIDKLLPHNMAQSLRYLEMTWTIPAGLLTCRECYDYSEQLWDMLASLKALRTLRLAFRDTAKQGETETEYLDVWKPHPNGYFFSWFKHNVEKLTQPRCITLVLPGHMRPIFRAYRDGIGSDRVHVTIDMESVVF